MKLIVIHTPDIIGSGETASFGPEMEKKMLARVGTCISYLREGEQALVLSDSTDTSVFGASWVAKKLGCHDSAIRKEFDKQNGRCALDVITDLRRPLIITFVHYPLCDSLVDCAARFARFVPYHRRALKRGEAMLLDPALPHPRVI